MSILKDDTHLGMFVFVFEIESVIVLELINCAWAAHQDLFPLPQYGITNRCHCAQF